jgi:HAD superfamily hydrolase (TIGR01484 family)
MKSVHEMPEDVVRKIRGVFFDIDDTFTLFGKIPPEAFSALYRLKEERVFAVPITGRPAGWCDHIARMWPVTGVVGENGALYFHYDEDKKKLKKRFFVEPREVEKLRGKLFAIGDEVIRKVPGTAYASDQPYRLFDIAIDFTEDVPPLPRSEINKITEIFSDRGLHYKVSSIHVNGWFGDYDKLTMTKLFAREVLGITLDDHKQEFLFVGDSPNDEPMFRFFPHSVGVSNVRQFLDLIKHPPTYVADEEGGRGFAEVVELISKKRHATGKE